MDSLERYLRQATRGLWGHKRLEVREELEAHILERARAFEVGGSSRVEAIEKVLGELGKPQAVSAGMVRLHTWPKAGFLASVMGLMAASLLLVQAQNFDVVPSLRLPIPSCIQGQDPSPDCQLFNIAWLKFEDVQKALEPQGVRFEQAFGRYTVQFPGTTQVTTWKSEYEGTINSEQPLPDYMPIHSLAIRFATQTKIPVRVEGWEKPRVWFGDKVNLGLSISGKVDFAHGLYTAMLVQQSAIFDQTFTKPGVRLIWKSLPPSQRESRDWTRGYGGTAWYLHRIRVNSASNTVLGVAMLGFGEAANDVTTVSLYIDAAPAKNGFVELYLPDAEVQFVGSFAEASRSSTGVSKAALVDLSKPYTKDGWSKAIVVPQNPLSKAVR